MRVGKFLIGLILIILSLSAVFFPIGFSLFGFAFINLSLFILGAILVVLGFRSVTYHKGFMKPGDRMSFNMTGRRPGIILLGLILIAIGLGMTYFPIGSSLIGFGVYEIILFLIGLFLIWRSFSRIDPSTQMYLNRTGKQVRV